MRFKSLLICLSLQLAAVFIFCIGFFPQKSVLNGSSTFQIEKSLQQEAPPVFSKLILVVIDALRSDFIFDSNISNFPFTHSLLNNGNAWGFTAYSNPPTVTLPRLKGLTTGSTPNFLDAILNVAEDDNSSNLKDQDSLLNQFYLNNKKIRFFGDDTWLKLFPLDYFEEHEGTNSFFVSDFTQVDNNVTRHIPKQLQEKNDWDVLILHYLGLDHIGHKGGPRSKFMPTKHEEMDGIIRQLYENLDNDGLLCILGDHGMNELGNHGGSSNGETSAAMVFASPKLSNFELPSKQKEIKLPITKPSEDENSFKYLTEIQQVDFVPTIATLFNLPIPRNSVGIIIEPLLKLLRNSKLESIKLKENYKQLLDLAHIHSTMDDISSLEDFELFTKMVSIQEDLTRSATNYFYEFLAAGIISSIIGTILYAVLITKDLKFNGIEIISIIISLLIGLSMFGSSFVEEEHQIWWWIVTGLITLSLYLKPNTKLLHLTLFICVRLIRGWNNSGQKYVYESTISNILSRIEYKDMQWYLILATITFVSFNDSMKNLPTFAMSLSLGVLVFSFKVSWSITNGEKVPFVIKDMARTVVKLLFPDESKDIIFSLALNPLAQLFFHCTLGFLVIKLLIQKLKIDKTVDNIFDELTKVMNLVAIMQTRPSNIPMFCVFEIMKMILVKIIKHDYNSNPYVTSIASLVLQHFTFFQFGGTNSIATVDLSNAYNGVSENYNIYYVGLLMTIANFAPSIYWAVFSWDILYSYDTNSILRRQNFMKSKVLPLLFYFIIGCFLFLSCFILRYHLFIWSVFSPKLCYYVAWSIFMNCIVGWVFEGILVLAHW